MEPIKIERGPVIFSLCEKDGHPYIELWANPKQGTGGYFGYHGETGINVIREELETWILLFSLDIKRGPGVEGMNHRFPDDVGRDTFATVEIAKDHDFPFRLFVTTLGRGSSNSIRTIEWGMDFRLPEYRKVWEFLEHYK